jgi:hypothetical protein
MLLKDALLDKNLDYRLRDRLLEENKISKEEVETYLSSLEDDSDNLEETTVKN